MPDEHTKTEEEINEKWSIHQIVQQAIATAHTTPAPQTIKMFDEMKADLKEIKEDVKSNLIQATKTNGRVSKAEEWSEKAQKVIEGLAEKVENNHDEYTKDKSRVQGIVWVLGFLMVVIPTACTVVFGLYLKNRDYDINERIRRNAEEVVLQIEQKYDLEIK